MSASPTSTTADSTKRRARQTQYARQPARAALEVDVEPLDVDGEFTLSDARAAMDGHVLAEASVAVKYTINPDAKEL